MPITAEKRKLNNELSLATTARLIEVHNWCARKLGCLEVTYFEDREVAVRRTRYMLSMLNPAKRPDLLGSDPIPENEPAPPPRVLMKSDLHFGRLCKRRQQFLDLMFSKRGGWISTADISMEIYGKINVPAVRSLAHCLDVMIDKYNAPAILNKRGRGESAEYNLEYRKR